MPTQHAVLSASSSKRWIHCPPSARLEEKFPNESSVYAEEGTLAHELGEYKIKEYLHAGAGLSRPGPVTEEMEQATDVYADYAVSIIESMRRSGCEPLCFVEERLDFSDFVPEGFGTGDMVILGRDENGRGLIHVLDYKHGKGVFVDSRENSQMMLYALGALNAYGYIYGAGTVRMTIVQPRMENISTFEMTADGLRAWGESIKPVARLAYEGKGEQRPGDWCRFCRARPVCRACLDEAMSLAREEFPDLDAGEPASRVSCLAGFQELAKALPTLSRVSSWIEAAFAFVSGEAIGHGVPVEGYKVVEGRSRRVFTDTDAVIQAARDHGYTDVYRRELLSPAEFEKMMGKKKFAEVLGGFVAKPPGKLSLVPESDPRPAVDVPKGPGASGAASEFESLE